MANLVSGKDFSFGNVTDFVKKNAGGILDAGALASDIFKGGGLVGDFAKDALSGFSEKPDLIDYKHASKLFVNSGSDSFPYAPKNKFLFHVYFTINDDLSPAIDKGLVGALVKSISLPSFDISTDEYVQYNRKRLVHKKIEYKPINVSFHDDSSNAVRSMWYNYYRYYFNDANHEYSNGGNNYDPRRIYEGGGEDGHNSAIPMGYTTAAKNSNAYKIPFFKDIKIFGMSRGRFVSYTLVNPVITSWDHDTYDYSQGNGVMEHKASIKYESVLYDEGLLDDVESSRVTRDGNPIGFGPSEPGRYDTASSKLNNNGGIASILGSGGALDTLSNLGKGNIFKDIQSVGSLVNTFKKSGSSFGDIVKGELIGGLKSKGIGLLSSAAKDTVFAKGGSISKIVNTASKPLAAVGKFASVANRFIK